MLKCVTDESNWPASGTGGGGVWTTKTKTEQKSVIGASILLAPITFEAARPGKKGGAAVGGKRTSNAIH